MNMVKFEVMCQEEKMTQVSEGKEGGRRVIKKGRKEGRKEGELVWLNRLNASAAGRLDKVGKGPLTFQFQSIDIYSQEIRQRKTQRAMSRPSPSEGVSRAAKELRHQGDARSIRWRACPCLAWSGGSDPSWNGPS
jgi:hypothetical protein